VHVGPGATLRHSWLETSRVCAAYSKHSRKSCNSCERRTAPHHFVQRHLACQYAVPATSSLAAPRRLSKPHFNGPPANSGDHSVTRADVRLASASIVKNRPLRNRGVQLYARHRVISFASICLLCLKDDLRLKSRSMRWLRVCPQRLPLVIRRHKPNLQTLAAQRCESTGSTNAPQFEGFRDSSSFLHSRHAVSAAHARVCTDRP
jgi:hypothetical protein